MSSAGVLLDEYSSEATTAQQRIGMQSVVQTWSMKPKQLIGHLVNNS